MTRRWQIHELPITDFAVLLLGGGKQRHEPYAADAEKAAQERSGNHIGDEVHSQDDPRETDIDRAEPKRGLEGGIEVAEGSSHRKGCDGMARRKRELVRRQNLRPAVRLNRARTS